jgi:hypothetical protein
MVASYVFIGLIFTDMTSSITSIHCTTKSKLIGSPLHPQRYVAKTRARQL